MIGDTGKKMQSSVRFEVLMDVPINLIVLWNGDVMISDRYLIMFSGGT